MFSSFILGQKFFDYDVDSDDEWEDEEENAESLKGDSDEDKESEDDYEIDNEFFVPHGYLSDGEGDSDDEARGDSERSAVSSIFFFLYRLDFITSGAVQMTNARIGKFRYGRMTKFESF
jgi:chromatin assembly factor 1 subunit A